jgi:hypothetical protein
MGPDLSGVVCRTKGDHVPSIDFYGKTGRGWLNRVLVAIGHDFLPWVRLAGKEKVNLVIILLELHFVAALTMKGEFLKKIDAHADQTDVLVQKIGFSSQEMQPEDEDEEKH